MINVATKIVSDLMVYFSNFSNENLFIICTIIVKLMTLSPGKGTSLIWYTDKRKSKTY